MSNRHPKRRIAIKPFPMKSPDVRCAQCGKGTTKAQTRAIDRAEGKATPSRVCKDGCGQSRSQ